MATLLGKILADFTTSLSTEIAVGGTTATLSTATDDDGVALPSGRYFFTVDGSNSSKEHFSCDLAGTALTNLKSLSRQGVETTGAVRKHRIGATVSLTDFGHIKFINDLIAGTTQLNSSAPLGYDGAPASLTGNQLATVTYVLGVVSGGTVNFDQQVAAGQTAGETLVVNDLVYFKESDQRWWKATAGLTASIDKIKIGFTKSAGAAGATIVVAISGPVSGFTGLTAGSRYYVSTTSGAITTTDPGYSEFVGWALSTTQILFVPIIDYVSTSEVSSSGSDQTQTSSNATIEVGEADATSKKNKIAQQFIAGKAKIRGVTIKKKADTGTFTGTVTIAIYSDNGSDAPNASLVSRTLSNAEWVAIATDGTPEVIFATEYASLTQGTKYWIYITTSTSDTSNHPNFAYENTNVYANGLLKYNNTTDSWVTVTGDLYFKTLEGNASQVAKTDPNGELVGFTKMPVVNTYTTANATIGSSTTQFDITNPSGTTFRYTWDGTGTDPAITSTSVPVGSLININAQNFNSANNGLFVVTGSGSNYFEVTNASGVAESNKTLGGDGYYLVPTTTTWTKPANLKYAVIEVVAGGGAGRGLGVDADGGMPGGSGGGYAKKTVLASALNAREYVLVGNGGQGSTGDGKDGWKSAFGSHCYATGGEGAISGTSSGTGGGLGVNGDINIKGSAGSMGGGTTASAVVGSGSGGSSFYGGGARGHAQAGADAAGLDGGPYGGGGSGSLRSGSGGGLDGGDGGDGIVIVTEYY